MSTEPSVFLGASELINCYIDTEEIGTIFYVPYF